MIKNYGLDLEKELAEQSDTDYVLGSEKKIIGTKVKIKGLTDNIAGIVTACHAWSSRIVNGIYQRTTNAINHCIISFVEKLKQYYPLGEVQFGYEDYMDCVTRGFVNELEKQLNWLVENGLLSNETISWLKEKGYFDELKGGILLSNRIPAKGSGTTRSGNSLKAVIQWIENNGIHPRRLLSEDKKMTFNGYYGFTMTKEMVDVGLESRKYIKINYAKVYRSDFPPLFGNFRWKIFDNYIDVVDNDFVKRLAKDYIFLGYGYKIIINDLKKNESEVINMIREKLEKYWKFGFHRSLDENALEYLKYDDNFVLNEVLRSEEYEKIDKVLEWMKSNSFWKIFLPAELRGIAEDLKKLDK